MAASMSHDRPGYGTFARAGRAAGLASFLPQETEVMLGDRTRRRVIVGPDLLLLWWGADSGPQTAEGLVEAHADEIARVVAAKLARGFRPRSDAVRIGEDDLE